MFFSAYWSDVQGGREFKGPGIKVNNILLWCEWLVAIKGMDKASLDVLFIK